MAFTLKVPDLVESLDSKEWLLDELLEDVKAFSSKPEFRDEKSPKARFMVLLQHVAKVGRSFGSLYEYISYLDKSLAVFLRGGSEAGATGGYPSRRLVKIASNSDLNSQIILEDQRAQPLLPRPVTIWFEIDKKQASVDEAKLPLKLIKVQAPNMGEDGGDYNDGDGGEVAKSKSAIATPGGRRGRKHMLETSPWRTSSTRGRKSKKVDSLKRKSSATKATPKRRKTAEMEFDEAEIELGLPGSVGAGEDERYAKSLRSWKFWRTMLSKLKEVKHRNGNFIITNSERNQPLVEWVAEQRELYHSKKLEEDRRQALEAIGFSWNVEDSHMGAGGDDTDANDSQDEGPTVKRGKRRQPIGDWDENFDKLKRFKEKHGHANVTSVSNDIVLIRWIKAQRYAFRTKQLSEDKINKLESVGFAWDASAAMLDWKDRLERLKAHKSKKGHFDVSPEEDADLANWLDVVRKDHNEKTLPTDLVNKLSAIGFSFDGSGDGAAQKKQAVAISLDTIPTNQEEMQAQKVLMHEEKVKLQEEKIEALEESLHIQREQDFIKKANVDLRVLLGTMETTNDDEQNDGLKTIETVQEHEKEERMRLKKKVFDQENELRKQLKEIQEQEKQLKTLTSLIKQKKDKGQATGI